MKRREFFALVGGATAWPITARAQQMRPVIGFLNGQSPGNFAHLVAAFQEGLAVAGYVNGRNVTIEYWWAEGNLARAPALAAELVRREVAVIVATGGAHHAAKIATSTIPIVCSMGGDPVKEGLVDSVNRPGGNLTGVSVFTATLEAQRLELLHELVPSTTRIAVLVDVAYPEQEEQVRQIEIAARAMSRQVTVLKIKADADIDSAFQTMHDQKIGAVSVAASPSNNSNRGRFLARAPQYNTPAVYENRETVLAGGLMSYGVNVPGVYQQIGAYTARILMGERPADLPVVLPTKFDISVNLKTAKALGIEVPTSILLRAAEVVE